MFTITLQTGFSQNKILQSLTNYIGQIITRKIIVIRIILKYIFVLYNICLIYVDIYCYIFIQILQREKMDTS
jgi:hypothetical protein